MSACMKCGVVSSLMFKQGDGYLCSKCFMDTSPIIDEGWRILKEVMDKMIEWEDDYVIQRKRASFR